MKLRQTKPMRMRSMRLRLSKLPMPLMLTMLRTPKPLILPRTRPMIQQSAEVDEPTRLMGQGKANKQTRPICR